MQYLYLAYLVAFVHGLLFLALVAFPVLSLSGFLNRHKDTRKVYFIGLFAFLIVSWFLPDQCPFTVWEHQLRQLAGNDYMGNFLTHYANAAGLAISDGQIFWIIMALLTTGFVGELARVLPAQRRTISLINTAT